MQQETAEKLKRIQSLFDAGKSHAQIAKELGYANIKSYYSYIYKYNDYLSYQKMFTKNISLVPKKEIILDTVVEDLPQTKENMSKAESIVSLIDRGIDIREVAKKKQFRDMQEMANYMKSKGYIWSSSAKNYVPVPQEKREPIEHMTPSEIPTGPEQDADDDRLQSSCDCLERYGDILKVLTENQESLLDLIARKEKGILHKYRIPGEVKTKSINIVNTLERLVNLFCDEMNITIKEAYETAMIEFLKNHGYGEEVNDLLSG